MKWLKFQKDFIKCDKSCIVVKGRQEGFTIALAFKVIKNRIIKKNNFIYTATGETFAKDFIQLCSEWAKKLMIPIISQTAQELILNIEGKSCKIIALSSNPKALRGYRDCDAAVDEFASHPDGNQLYDAIMPYQTHGGTIDFISTVGSPFHKHQELFNKAEELGYVKFKIDIYDAVEQGLAEIDYIKTNGKIDKPIEEINKEYINRIRKAAGEDTFAREYECKVPIAGSSLITPELYDNLVIDNRLDYLEDKSYGQLYVGFDIGRSHDLSVISVYEYIGQNANLILIKVMENIPYQNQFEESCKIIGHPKVCKCCVDAGGIGAQIAEDLNRKFGNMVEKITFNNQNKKQMYDKMQKMAQQGRINFPDNKQIKEDVCSIRRVFSTAGIEHYEGGTAFSHADYATSFALSIQGIPEDNLGKSWSIGKRK
jgi:phage FluMu gp28-like protein